MNKARKRGAPHRTVYQHWPSELKEALRRRAHREGTDMTTLTIRALVRAYPELRKCTGG